VCVVFRAILCQNGVVIRDGGYFNWFPLHFGIEWLFLVCFYLVFLRLRVRVKCYKAKLDALYVNINLVLSEFSLLNTSLAMKNEILCSTAAMN
jgi:hypothetical protein